MTSADVKRQAKALGFDACGIAPASDHPELGFLNDWLDRGYAGSMDYLARSADRRADVRRVLPSARTVIVTATLYNTERPYSTECADPARAHIARYAWGDDYHVVLRERMTALLSWMREQSAEPFDAVSYVDTGPVQERVYAQYAGIGWIAKNTCVINGELGSWIFLAEIICSLPLETDVPAFDQCGTCTLCLEACPTQALVSPGVLDSNRCISYLTIEHRGEIPHPLRAGIGNHVYGCDICQEVCPWNAVAPATADPAWQPRAAWDTRSVVELLQMTDDEMRAAMKGSAMKRTKVSGLRRNLDAAAENMVDGGPDKVRRGNAEGRT
jgi:epoxyqueuosine reductase